MGVRRGREGSFDAGAEGGGCLDTVALTAALFRRERGRLDPQTDCGATENGNPTFRIALKLIG